VIRKNNAQGIPAAGEDPNLRGGVIEIDDPRNRTKLLEIFLVIF
jgi:hypothetical protein